jgi:hypothetical protein
MKNIDPAAQVFVRRQQRMSGAGGSESGHLRKVRHKQISSVSPPPKADRIGDAFVLDPDPAVDHFNIRKLLTHLREMAPERQPDHQADLLQGC